MSIFIGKIEKIEEEFIGSIYYKKVVTIVNDNQTGYFEFRNAITMKYIETIEQGDEVRITYVLQGKTTKSLMKCNNLVGQTIEKLNTKDSQL